MPTKKLLFLYFFTHFISLVSAQAPFQVALEKITIEQSQEKTYLHLDKSQYITGEIMWFKAYVINAVSHQPSTTSKTMYVELIDPAKQVVDSLTLFIRNGTTHGSFSLSPDLLSGTYRIRAYTQWMRNFEDDFLFRRELTILNANDQVGPLEKTTETSKELIIDFLPEGGDLIDGIASKIAIRSTDINGNGQQVKGEIVDQKGIHITNFETNKQGYGLVFFIPVYNNSYYALTDHAQLDLPEVKATGAVIRAIHSNTSQTVILSILSKNIDLSGGTLVMHRHGQFLLSQECLNKNTFAVSINKSDLGTGIINVTFFDNRKIPLTERLIFPNPPSNDPAVNISSDKNNYETRSKVSMTLHTVNEEVHSASITINPEAESSYKKYGVNIKNYLLLSSDLKGQIDSPGYFFEGSKESYQALDLVMLTHGWSRFDWAALLDRSKEFYPSFLAEQGLKIVGKASNFYNDKSIKDAILGVSIPSLGVLNETTTLAKDGSFQIDGFSLMDSTNIYLQVYKNKLGKNSNYKRAYIHLTALDRPMVRNFSNSTSKVNPAHVEKANTLEQISNLYFLDKEAKELDEVIVKARSIKKEEMDQRTLYTNPSDRIILDSMKYDQGARSIFDLLRNIAGIRVSGTFPTQSASLTRSNTSINAGGNAPLYVVDGMPTDEDLVNSIALQDVEFIDVLKGPRAAIYGSRGSGGAILIYTRKNGLKQPEDISPEGFYVFVHPGYHQAKEFYSPQYNIPRDEHKVPDYRTTLYWNPELNFKNGRSEIDFYTSDQSGSLSIRLEGILTNGEPFFEEKTIMVEQNN